MPITAFIGVRISWLIVARNELFASLAASAAARASCACLNSRAFWIAITAWWAKVLSSAISFSENAAGGLRRMLIVPMPCPCQSIGAIISEYVPLPYRRAKRRRPGGTSASPSTSTYWLTPRSCIARSAAAALQRYRVDAFEVVAIVAAVRRHAQLMVVADELDEQVLARE